LLALLASLAAAFLGYRHLAGWLERIVPQLGVWIAPLSFVATFLLVHFVLAGIALSASRRLPGRVHGNVANRFLGLAPGALNGAINAVVVAVVLLVRPLGATVSGWVRDTVLAGRLSQPAEWVEARLAPIFDPAVQRSLQALTVPQQSRTTIQLPTRVEQAAVREQLEARMLGMVNAEREKQGLKPLRPDPELAEVARAHSRDMFARGYFSHYSPEGQDLRDRLRRAGHGYLAAGENLALAPTLAGAHQGLMNSPGHRAN